MDAEADARAEVINSHIEAEENVTEDVMETMTSEKMRVPLMEAVEAKFNNA